MGLIVETLLLLKIVLFKGEHCTIMDTICFSDFTIKIVDISSGDTKKFEGHEAPVLSVALDPKEEFLVSVLCGLLKMSGLNG